VGKKGCKSEDQNDADGANIQQCRADSTESSVMNQSNQIPHVEANLFCWRIIIPGCRFDATLLPSSGEAHLPYSLSLAKKIWLLKSMATANDSSASSLAACQ
jgi:hypothetical protein